MCSIYAIDITCLNEKFPRFFAYYKPQQGERFDQHRTYSFQLYKIFKTKCKDTFVLAMNNRRRGNVDPQDVDQWSGDPYRDQSVHSFDRKVCSLLAEHVIVLTHVHPVEIQRFKKKTFNRSFTVQ